MRKSAFGLVAIVVAVGCSNSKSESTTANAAAAAPESVHAIATRLASADAAFAKSIHAEHPFVAAMDHGFDAHGALTPRLPADASASRRFALTSGPLELALLGARKVSGQLDEGSLVYPGAFDRVDDVLVSSSQRFEEFLLIRASVAPHTFTWRLSTPGLHLHAMADGSGRIEDAGGRALVTIPMPIAIDAKGVQRLARLSVENDDLRVTLDAASDDAYPILLDPALETYAWIDATTTAGFVTNGNAPAIAYDPGIKKLVMFGGVNTLADAGKTWVRDSSGPWTALAITSPGARSNPALAYDSGRGVLVMFGGQNASGNLNETWEFNGTSWSQKSPTGSLPLARSTHGLAYDANRGKVVMAGGSWGFQDTWEWNGTSWTETISSGGPAMEYVTLVYDAKAKVVRLIGGLQAGTSGPTSKMLQYTGTSWTVTTPTGSAAPSARYDVAAAYDTARGVTVLFGGLGPSAVPLNDTWEFDGTQWFQRILSTSFVPAPFYFQVGAFDASHGTFNMVGAQKSAAANSTWQYQAVGGACATAADCDTGFCVDGVCCQVASCGSCEACVASTSGATCQAVKSADDPDTCTGTKSCDAAGACKAKNGQACAASSGCVSGFCVDGVCCDTSCTGQCQACDVGTKVGTCTSVVGKPHGTRAACASGATDPACAATCDGTDTAKCNDPGSSTSCGAATCSGGNETHVGTCDGSGGCNTTPKACAPYACNTSTCFASCTVDGNCAAGNYCKAGLCVPNEALGKPCTSSTACGTLSCTDGFCCGQATCGAGQTCGFPGKEGTCVSSNGGSCTLGSDCGTGNCIDGVCCDTACDGQCEACDVPDSATGVAGKCIPVAGKPHGKRAACADGGADTCASAACDGTTTASCAAFTGSETVCRPQSCADGVLTAKAVCDGAGSCPKVITSKCDGFACTADGIACETSCVDDTKCVAGFVCKAGKCSQKTATCSADKTSSVGVDGTPVPCAPYLCGTDGTCIKACATTDDCASGSSCDVASKTCTATSGGDGGTGSGGGCSFGDEGTSSSLAWLSFGTLAMISGLVRRARRR